MLHAYTHTYVRTYIGPPSPINDFDAREICDTTISGVSWTPSSSDPVCGPISYELTVSPTDQMIMIMRINDTSYDITGLISGTSYNLTVISSNMAGSVESVMMISTPNTNEIVPSGECINTAYTYIRTYACTYVYTYFMYVSCGQITQVFPYACTGIRICPRIPVTGNVTSFFYLPLCSLVLHAGLFTLHLLSYIYTYVCRLSYLQRLQCCNMTLQPLYCYALLGNKHKKKDNWFSYASKLHRLLHFTN